MFKNASKTPLNCRFRRLKLKKFSRGGEFSPLDFWEGEEGEKDLGPVMATKQKNMNKKYHILEKFFSDNLLCFNI